GHPLRVISLIRLRTIIPALAAISSYRSGCANISLPFVSCLSARSRASLTRTGDDADAPQVSDLSAGLVEVELRSSPRKKTNSRSCCRGRLFSTPAFLFGRWTNPIPDRDGLLDYSGQPWSVLTRRGHHAAGPDRTGNRRSWRSAGPRPGHRRGVRRRGR